MIIIRSILIDDIEQAQVIDPFDCKNVHNLILDDVDGYPLE